MSRKTDILSSVIKSCHWTPETFDQEVTNTGLSQFQTHNLEV